MPKALRDFLGLSFFFWSNEQGGLLELWLGDEPNKELLLK
jgi:hypothetical protein